VLNVLVTGGSRGLGLGIARNLTAVGYSVIAIARQESEQLAAARKEHQRQGAGRLDFRPFDLANSDDIQGFVRRLRAEFGPIYGLVNNAGLGTSGLLAMTPNRAIEELIRTNTLSPIVLTKYVVRAMMSSGGGRIVNIASVVGLNGYRGLSVYGATKASIIGFTRSLAREVGALNITVNAIAPGFVDTAMTKALSQQERERVRRRSALGRLAEVSDIANAVEFLLGDRAKNITGTVLTVDAGNTA
jgi:3-oxoacyl-[acyl-carrier protein] reductase